MGDFSSTPEKDRALLSGCLSGDRPAAEILVRRYSDLVYKTVQHVLLTRHVTFSHQDLQDLHNTVFLELFENDCKKLRHYRGLNGCSLASWIRLIAVRIVLNQLRKREVGSFFLRKRESRLEDLPELADEAADAWTEMERAEKTRLLHEGMQRLPTRERLFLGLLVNQGLTLKEVAGVMHLSMENAYTIKHRALKKLKDMVASTS